MTLIDSHCHLDGKTFQGIVTMEVDSHFQFPKDSSAKILTAGLLGDQYIGLDPGNDDRNLMPNHLLQWETMRWARANGCTAYDLWGVPDEVGIDADAPIPDPATGLWGVWRFKRGFGGRVVRYAGAWDRLAAPMLAGLAGAFMR